MASVKDIIISRKRHETKSCQYKLSESTQIPCRTLGSTIWKYVCTYKAACVCWSWSWSWNVSFDKYRIWCLSATSRDDSLSTTSIPKTFPNFVILFTLHHSLLAPPLFLPHSHPCFSSFSFITDRCPRVWWCNSSPPPLFFPSSSSLTVVTQYCCRTSPATAVLIVVLAAFDWVPQQVLPASMMSHRKSTLSYSSSCTLPPPFSVFSRI